MDPSWTGSDSTPVNLRNCLLHLAVTLGEIIDSFYNNQQQPSMMSNNQSQPRTNSQPRPNTQSQPRTIHGRTEDQANSIINQLSDTVNVLEDLAVNECHKSNDPQIVQGNINRVNRLLQTIESRRSHRCTDQNRNFQALLTVVNDLLDTITVVRQRNAQIGECGRERTNRTNRRQINININAMAPNVTETNNSQFLGAPIAFSTPKSVRVQPEYSQLDIRNTEQVADSLFNDTSTETDPDRPGVDLNESVGRIT